MTQRFELDDGVFSLGEMVETIRQEVHENMLLSKITLVDVNNVPIQTAVLIDTKDDEGKKIYKLMLF